MQQKYFVKKYKNIQEYIREIYYLIKKTNKKLK